MTNFKYAFFEGKVNDLENAKVSIMTNALQYGTAVFGGIRGYYDNEEKIISVFRIRDHYKRFLSSIKLLGCDFPHSIDKLECTNMQFIFSTICLCWKYQFRSKFA
jgi:branched-chain amino acid aminotransferase